MFSFGDQIGLVLFSCLLTQGVLESATQLRHRWETNCLNILFQGRTSLSSKTNYQRLVKGCDSFSLKSDEGGDWKYFDPISGKKTMGFTKINTKDEFLHFPLIGRISSSKINPFLYKPNQISHQQASKENPSKKHSNPRQKKAFRNMKRRLQNGPQIKNWMPESPRHDPKVYLELAKFGHKDILWGRDVGDRNRFEAQDKNHLEVYKNHEGHFLEETSMETLQNSIYPTNPVSNLLHNFEKEKAAYSENIPYPKIIDLQSLESKRTIAHRTMDFELNRDSSYDQALPNNVPLKQTIIPFDTINDMMTLYNYTTERKHMNTKFYSYRQELNNLIDNFNLRLEVSTHPSQSDILPSTNTIKASSNSQLGEWIIKTTTEKELTVGYNYPSTQKNIGSDPNSADERGPEEQIRPVPVHQWSDESENFDNEVAEGIAFSTTQSSLIETGRNNSDHHKKELHHSPRQYSYLRSYPIRLKQPSSELKSDTLQHVVGDKKDGNERIRVSQIFQNWIELKDEARNSKTIPSIGSVSQM